MAFQLRGPRIYGDMAKRPETAHGLFAFVAAVVARATEILLDLGADVVALVDSSATTLKPDVFREYAISYAQPALAAIHARRATSSWWG